MVQCRELTVPQLKDRCRQLHITGFSRKTKPDLITLCCKEPPKRKIKETPKKLLQKCARCGSTSQTLSERKWCSFCEKQHELIEKISSKKRKSISIKPEPDIDPNIRKFAHELHVQPGFLDSLLKEWAFISKKQPEPEHIKAAIYRLKEEDLATHGMIMDPSHVVAFYPKGVAQSYEMKKLIDAANKPVPIPRIDFTKLKFGKKRDEILASRFEHPSLIIIPQTRTFLARMLFDDILKAIAKGYKDKDPNVKFFTQTKPDMPIRIEMDENNFLLAPRLWEDEEGNVAEGDTKGMVPLGEYLKIMEGK